MAETGDSFRIVSHDREDGTHIIAAVRRGGEADQLTDEEIMAQFDDWKFDRSHLHAVDDE